MTGPALSHEEDTPGEPPDRGVVPRGKRGRRHPNPTEQNVSTRAPGGGPRGSEDAGLTSRASPGPRLALPADAASREPGAPGGARTSLSEMETMVLVNVCRLMCGKR